MLKLQTNHFTRRLIEAYDLWQRTCLRKNWPICKETMRNEPNTFKSCNFQLSIQLSTISNKQVEIQSSHTLFNWFSYLYVSFGGNEGKCQNISTKSIPEGIRLTQFLLSQLWWKGGKMIYIISTFSIPEGMEQEKSKLRNIPGSFRPRVREYYRDVFLVA